MLTTSIPIIDGRQLAILIHQGIDTTQKVARAEDCVLLSLGFSEREIVDLQQFCKTQNDAEHAEFQRAKQAAAAALRAQREDEHKRALTVEQLIERLREFTPTYKVLIPDGQGSMGYISSIEVLIGRPGNFPFDEETFDRVELS